MKTYLLLVLMLAFSAACHSPEAGSNENQAAPVESTGVSAGFAETDSVEFIYFPDPSDQKLYSNRIISDSVFVRAIVSNLQMAPAGNITECPHKQKIYLFKNGNVFKTIYLSDSCNYLAYAVNSNQQFIPMSSEIRHMTDSIRKTMQAL